MKIYQLRQRQSLPLACKIAMTENKIREWYDYWRGRVYVSFSGGLDSTVLLHIVRSLYPHVPAVFCDTGLEYPEIRKFVQGFNNLTVLKPKMNFKAVLDKYGYPVVSKEQACAISRYRNTKDTVQKYRRLHGWPKGKKGMISKKWQFLINAPFRISDKCCDIIKKDPFNRYAKETKSYPMMGMTAAESRSRTLQYLDRGCNALYSKSPVSWPIAFWTREGIKNYIKLFKLPYASVYDMGYERTGCMFCMFGLAKEKFPNRFERMAHTHPKQYKYCMDVLGLREVLVYIKEGGNQC